MTKTGEKEDKGHGWLKDKKILENRMRKTRKRKLICMKARLGKNGWKQNFEVQWNEV